MDLRGKVCLVTGGTSGIGAAISQQLVQRQANVITVGRSNTRHTEFISKLAPAGSDNSGRISFLAGDLSSPDECLRVARAAEAEFGHVDVLVHSAGGPAPGGILDIGPEEWRKAFDLHVHAIFYLAQALLPEMKRRKEGAILLIGSAAGLRGCLGALAYGVVKGALPQFARALARELADFNIRVNCISPGVIRTPFQDFLTPAQVKNNIDNRIPLHREGTPDDVAGAALTLLENDFITGENLVVDGGMSMRIV